MDELMAALQIMRQVPVDLKRLDREIAELEGTLATKKAERAGLAKKVPTKRDREQMLAMATRLTEPRPKRGSSSNRKGEAET
jgi:hypothetical protein